MECPKSDKLSPFRALYLQRRDVFVKLNESDDKCQQLITIGGANVSALFEASKTCGAAGEWKRRVAEELSAVFFVGGWDTWPKNEHEKVEVETELGVFEVPVSAENYET